ncbi:dihydrofolate reductase family protein [Variovorax dokdonensis]|uniref:Dihydrofolate reductase family protein n=1 Tax=Variovorax dokdonensis TaxID=344883 RepID=A0ABT7N6B1_9BURK|nr:dihydrofolate reductase family protein [Variovorax dokdonensis]MDM0043484.1 dihydrofolate reductase family protein [Variovorax dokdonensis]
MPRLRFRISMSLDGFVAGPQQGLQHPLGIGGERLHDWAFETLAFRRHLGLEGGIVNESSAIIEEQLGGVGASLMGRHMFGGPPGSWNVEDPWNGWWGDNPPFHHPVFVLTHHARPPLALHGGTTFYFVTDGLSAAVERAKAAAGGLDVLVGGGAKTAQQCLSTGRVDCMDINLAPILLGDGERLFDGVGSQMHGLQLTRTVTTSKVVHLRFERAQGPGAGA